MELERRHPLESWLPAGLIVLSLLLYWPALRVFFSLDDLRFLLRAAGIEEEPHGIRRVLSGVLYFKAAWALFGVKSYFYHLVTILLHAVNAALVYRIALRLRLDRTAGISAAVIFLASTAAFLPLHWISGIQEVSMTFFALLAAYYYLGSDVASMVLSLVTAALAVLCKEASLLVLPGVALTVPAPRKRRIVLGAAGLALAAAYLVASGSLEPKPSGDPYESVFGVNILWNLLTYGAWLVRMWDYFPDRIPQYRMALAGWGLILPAALAFVALRYRKARAPIARASLLFLALLLPVLGLVRHSYLYYLYLPLIPFWLLAGAALGAMSRPRLAAGIVACAVVFSAVTGTLHRNAQIRPGVFADPVLRYAAIAQRGVSSLAATIRPPEGTILFVRSSEGDTIDLAGGLEGRTGKERRTVHLFRVALLDGAALRLFFPALSSVHFEGPGEVVPGWERMLFYGAYGLAETVYLGQGKDGRMNFAYDLIEAGMLDRANREIGILLERYPDSPKSLYLDGLAALELGDMTRFDHVMERLDSLTVDEFFGTEAVNAMRDLHARSMERR